jgi:hypothetical protein
MILGIGSDIVDVRRIEQTIARHGERFLARIFTDVERATAERRARRAETYAKRFAAKEACRAYRRHDYRRRPDGPGLRSHQRGTVCIALNDFQHAASREFLATSAFVPRIACVRRSG